jgi:large repetitive protein
MKPRSIPGYLLAFAAAFTLATALGAQSAGPDITTWQVNTQHTGNNSSEAILTPGNVGATGNFGLLFTQQLDGQSYGQPLFVTATTLAKLPGSFGDGKSHNVVYVATEHNSIYAFDADVDRQGANPNGTNSLPLWTRNLTPAGATTVPQGETGSSDISTELGITATPVIDAATGTIYVVSKVKNPSATPTPYQQFLHALDLKTGVDKPGSPVLLDSTTVSFDGTPDPQKHDDERDPVTAPAGKIAFSALHEHLRCAMALSHGVLYLAYASHSDTRPYYGEILGFDAGTLKLVRTFIATPNASGQAGIWQGGASPAFDDAGNMFFSTGNGNWGQQGSTADWGESILKLPADMMGQIQISQQDVVNFFTPAIWKQLNEGSGIPNGPGPDRDLGGGGLLLLPDQPGGHPHLMVGGGKAGTLYLLDRDNLGGILDDDRNAIQEITEPNTNSLFMTPSYFNGSIYYAPAGNPIQRRTLQFDEVNNVVKFSDPPQSGAANDNYSGKGATVFISSNGAANGIVWAVKSSLEAYDATNLANHIFSSRTNVPGPTSSGCNTAKFTPPVVSNGKVYLTCSSNTNQGYLFVYGLIPAAPGTPQAPSDLVAQGSSSSQVSLSWTSNIPEGTSFAGFHIRRATAPTGPFATVGTAASNALSYTDGSNLQAGTTYFYQVTSFNGNGDSLSSNTASGTTFPVFLPSGLVAYWPMDDGPNATSVADVTGNGHTAAIPPRNEALYFPQGYIGGAWSFHGTQSTDELIVSDAPALRFTANQSFTLSAWVKVDNLTSAEQPVLAKAAGSSSPYGLWVNAANQWVFRGAAGDLVGPAVTQGVWTNLALVQDASKDTRYLYVNGVKQSLTASAQQADGAGDLLMGQQNINGVVSGFQGEIDDARLYNIALPPDSITGILAPPVLEASSLQTQGAAGIFGVTLYPGASAQVESRAGSIPGSYNIALHFPVAVAGVTANLGVQSGVTQAAIGQVSSVSYDSTGTIATVALTGVQNGQALNLHLAGFYAQNDVPGKEIGVPVIIPGTADIPFNVLQGDVTGDRSVDQADFNAVKAQASGIPVTQANAVMDVNSDGLINYLDTAIITSQLGKVLTVQTDTNLALFKTAVASSINGGNDAPKAVDAIDSNDSRWESQHAHDPEWLYVDLGASAQISSVDIDWENASAQNYVLEYSNDQGDTPANWQPFATITNNPGGGGHVVSRPVNAPAIGRFVRVTGTVRNTQFGYSIKDFKVFGFFSTDSGTPTAPTITSATTASGVVGSAFSYRITASQNPTIFGATGLPAGLSVNAAGLITGTPTSAGTSSVTITATNAVGTGSATLTLTISNTQPDTNLALFKTAVASSINGGNDASKAVDAIDSGDSRWESQQGHDPEWLYVDLGASAQISSIDIDWENASAQNYILEYSNDQADTPANWQPFATITNNPGGGGHVVSRPVNTPAIGRFVRVTGTTRNTPYGYSINDLKVLGSFVPQGTAPTITSASTASGVAGSTFSYQIAASQNPTAFGATGLPAGLSVNAAGLISGTPTTAGTSSVTITATNAVGTGSAALTLTITSPAPQPPANLSAVGGSGQINLNWSASAGATSYSVFRGTASGAETQIATPGGTAYTDTAVNAGTTYFYFVKAANSAGSSVASNEVSATPVPAVTIPLPPTDLSAVAGNSSVALTWSPSAGASLYNVLRGTTAGGENPSPVASNLTSAAYTDTTVTNGTAYFYQVTAANTAGVSGPSNEASATPALPAASVAIYQIDSGSSAGVASFSADQNGFVDGGNNSVTNNTILTDGVADAAPMKVYQSNRFGVFTYTIPALTPGKSYTVRLHFAEAYWTEPGRRVFDVIINGQTALSAFDIVQKAGGANIAVVQSLTATANNNGQIVIAFIQGSHGVDNPQVNGIEILSSGGSMPPPASPTGLSATAGNNQVSLAWSAGTGPAGTYQVFRGVAPGAESSTPVASGLSGTHFIDTSVTNQTTYYYTVKAANGGGLSIASNEATAVPGRPVTGTPIYRIAAGTNTTDAGIAPFVSDTNFSGGNGSGSANTIDTGAVISPAPLAVYQHERAGGTFSYTLPNLTPQAKYTVRLHFAEFYWTDPGKRIFNVSINGLTVLSNFDIVATAGAANKAVIEEFTATADSAGNITVQYSPGSADQPKASGIEIYQ